jgi:hypothetical protein
VDVVNISYEDNTPILDMFLNDKPTLGSGAKAGEIGLYPTLPAVTQVLLMFHFDSYYSLLLLSFIICRLASLPWHR